MLVAYRKAAIKALGRMPSNEARRIRSKIKEYAVDPRSQANNVTKLQGRVGYRLRVGEWRVIFDQDSAVLDVIHIGPRGGIYDR
jgi:mRNA interferase RelE/StbE